MSKISDYLSKFKKNISVYTVISCSALITVCGVVKALESNFFDSTTTDTDETSSYDTETPLTTEEIDKIIQDIKISGSIDNILEKLDEIIKRAQLSGNSALQEYATNMKTSYELQKQLDSVNSLIQAMKKKNSGIASVDEEVQKILSVETLIPDLQGAVSDEALLVLESLSNDDAKKLQETLAEIENIFDLKDVSALNVQQRSLLDILLLDKVIEEGLVKDERLELAKDTRAVAITILQSYQKENYSPEEYANLTEGTERFLDVGRKSSSVLPEQIVLMDGHFNMKHSPIMYDDHILLALDDLYQYIDAKIDYMYNNATMVITSPNKILEIVSGKNVAYLNDKPFNMPVPILSFEDTIYMSIEFFAQAYDISYKYLPEYDFVVLYHNLLQLEDSSVPNQLNKG